MDGEQGIPRVALAGTRGSRSLHHSNLWDLCWRGIIGTQLRMRKTLERRSLVKLTNAKETTKDAKRRCFSATLPQSPHSSSQTHRSNILTTCAQWGKVPTVRVAFVFSVLLPLAPAYCRSAHFSKLKSTLRVCVCTCTRVSVHARVSSESPGSYDCSQLLSLRHSLLCSALWGVQAATVAAHWWAIGTNYSW